MMDYQKSFQTSTTKKSSDFEPAVKPPNTTGYHCPTVEVSANKSGRGAGSQPTPKFCSAGISSNPCPVEFSETKGGLDSWGSNTSNGCSAGISPNPCPVLLLVNKERSKVANQSSEKVCSTGISQNPCPVGFSETQEGLDSWESKNKSGCSAGISQNLCPIELSGNKGEWGVASQPTSKVCSAGIRQNPCSVEVSASQSQLEADSEAWGAKRAIERPKRLSQIQTQKWKLRRLIIPAEQKPLITDSLRVARRIVWHPIANRGDRREPCDGGAMPDCFSEENEQLTTFTNDHPPNPDDFGSEAAYLKARAYWLPYPKLAETLGKRETQTIPAEQQIHIPAEQKPETETIESPRTRNTKLGRGSCPKQLNCNVKRNGSKGKSPNTYWVYQFSFKVDGKYFKRSCSIPKNKVNRVIEMWESKQYCWREIVEYLGKNPDQIVDKAGKKKEV